MTHRALNDDGLAEEAVQETFLRAWRAADRYDPHRSSLRTWMFAIARNVTIDLARARSARPEQRRGPAEVEHTQEEEAKDTTEESLRSWEVEEALRQIGPHHRHAIVETYYRDRPCAEVAAEAGVPVGTMRSRLYYGLKALRSVMEGGSRASRIAVASKGRTPGRRAGTPSRK